MPWVRTAGGSFASWSREALLLAATGGVLGVALAHALLVALLALYPARLPGGRPSRIQLRHRAVYGRAGHCHRVGRRCGARAERDREAHARHAARGFTLRDGSPPRGRGSCRTRRQPAGIERHLARRGDAPDPVLSAAAAGRSGFDSDRVLTFEVFGTAGTPARSGRGASNTGRRSRTGSRRRLVWRALG